jgi:hypothetical protein
MAVEVVPLSAGGQGERVVIDRHLYLTEDKTRVVEEAHPDGRWLWASPGTEVLRAEAERLGAVAKPDVKQRTPAENKQRRGRTTKSDE